MVLLPTTFVYDGCDFRSCVLSHVPKRNIKTKLQINTSPAAGINILCAPSMGEGIERYRIIPEGVNPLQASWRSLLVPLKSWIVDKSQGGLL